MNAKTIKYNGENPNINQLFEKLKKVINENVE